MCLDLTISAIRDVTDRVRVLELSARDGVALPDYPAGAHVEFDLGALGKRSYSLIDWPGDAPGRESYRIAVQREDDGDGGSRAMHGRTIGDTLRASEPMNDFDLGGHAGPVLLLAGGIGVTPIISMASALLRDGRAFSFHYAARSRHAMAFADDLEAAFGDHLHLHYDDVAPLDLDALMAALDPATHIYVCGPKGMIDATRTAMTAAGLPAVQFHAELFTSPAAQKGDVEFEVEISSTGQVFTIPAGKSIIEVLGDAGVDLIYDCQRGDCGICQTDVISGTPDHRDVVLSDGERAEGKVMQICVSRAKSDRLVLDL